MLIAKILTDILRNCSYMYALMLHVQDKYGLWLMLANNVVLKLKCILISMLNSCTYHQKHNYFQLRICMPTQSYS